MTAAINRPLDEQEKSLLCWLAVQTVAMQTGRGEQDAADALDTLAGEGEAVTKADARDAFLVAAGHPLVHITREALAFYAHAGEWEQDPPA
jgi:hypothetical protein